MKKKLLLGLGACAMAFGGAFLIAHSVKPTIANAAGTPAAADTVMYIDVTGNSGWESDSAKTFVWVSESNDVEHNPDKWVATENLGGQLYSFTLPATYSKMTIARCNPSYDAAGKTVWDNSSVWNQSKDVEFNGNNFIALGAYDNGDGHDGKAFVTYECSRVAIAAHTKFYVDVSALSSWWNDQKIGEDDPYTYLRFFAEGSVENRYKMTRVGSSSLYYCDIGKDAINARGVIVVRAKNGFDEETGWEKKSHQSADIIFYKSGEIDNRACNAIIMDSSVVGENKFGVHGFEAVSDRFIGEAYAKYFLGLDLCLDEGGMKDGSATLWGQAKSTYDATVDLLADENYIADATADAASEHKLEQALARYEAVVTKNSNVTYSNFMSRTLSPSVMLPAMSPKSNNVVTFALIGVISFAVLALLVGGAILRKKKSN